MRKESLGPPGWKGPVSKLSAAQNPFKMSLSRGYPASDCTLPLAESSLPSVSEDCWLETVSYAEQKC